MDTMSLDALATRSAAGEWVAKGSRVWRAIWQRDVGRNGFFPFGLMAAALILDLGQFQCAAASVRVGRDPLMSAFQRGRPLLVSESQVQASAKVVAQELGVSRPSLYKWKDQLRRHDAPASTKRRQDAPASPDRAGLEQQLETLQLNIRRLQLEKDLLKKANELLKKELGIDQQRLTNREKTLLLDALRSAYALTELLCQVGLPRSSCFYPRARLEAADQYVEARQAMTDIFERNYHCYGYRRMHP